MNFKDNLKSYKHTLPVIMGTFIVIRFDYEIICILYVLTRFGSFPDWLFSAKSTRALFLVTYPINTLRNYNPEIGDDADTSVLKQLDMQHKKWPFNPKI